MLLFLNRCIYLSNRLFMFFSERIVSVKESDYVLEVGPGGNPYHRSDILLEKRFSDDEWLLQSGNVKPNSFGKKIIFYDGGQFPFADKEFDYVICSHVLEHVDNVDEFVRELIRVGKRGYIEYPTIYYDYIFNFKVHKTFLLEQNGVIYWMPKHESNFEQFRIIQDFFLKTLNEGKYEKWIYQLSNYLIQGFEWSNDIKTERVNSLQKVCYNLSNLTIPEIINKDEERMKKLEADIQSILNSKTYKIGEFFTGKTLMKLIRS